MNYKTVEEKIRTIPESTVNRYESYWFELRPRNDIDKLNRWLFAFVSIRAQWKANKEAYMLLANEIWETKNELNNILDKSRIGLVSMREKAIWEFREALKRDKSIIQPQYEDNWQSWRNRLVKQFYGIGLAKVSFSMEMCYPLECGVVCLDTHMLRMYGVDPKKGCSKQKYEEIERHWVDICMDMGYPSAMVRHILWDKIQNKRSTRYWSHVFEDKK